jgi:hypothetical protein
MSIRLRLQTILLASLVTLLTAGGALAQVTADDGHRAFAAQEWQHAADIYQEIAKASKADGIALLRLATALIHLGRAGEAFAWIDQAEKAGAPAAGVAFRRACALARDQEPAAIEELRRAVMLGLGAAQIESEPLLATLRATPRFQAVRIEIDRLARPCRHNPRYRAFDFWIGAWDVRPNGAPETTPPSENILTLEYDDCVIMEHWTSTSGGTGSSFNIFDASRGKWYQTWVDSGGGLHEYSGNPDADGNMIFTADLAPPPGGSERVPTRLSFFQQGPDTVRQLSESTSDGGKTWTVNYDLIYKRRKPAEKKQ